MQRTLIILLVSLIPFNSFIMAETYINGEVSGAWIKSNSPYIATGNLRLPKGKNLTIQPGVTVKFKGAYRFEIYGRLEAIGAVTDTIVFTHYTNHPDSTWRGLRYNQADSTGSLEYCKIEYVKAAGASSEDYKGGGLYINEKSNITIKNCLIRKNKADYGAGIYINYASPKIVATTVKDNSAYYDGGGIWMEHSAVLIVNSRFQNNYARYYGGGIYQNNASKTPLVYGSSFFNNRADYNRVHDLYCYTIVLVNSVFSNNISWPNTAILFYKYDSQIRNCIFDYTEYAKTINLRFDAKVEIINSVIMNANFTASDGDLKNLSIQYSNIQGGSPGEGNINADPLFVDRKQYDYHLKTNSPCKNVGHPAVFYNDGDGSRNDLGIFGGSGLYVQPLQLDFGPLGISQEKIDIFTIRNFRDTEMGIQSMSTADNQNFAPITGVPVRIQPMSYQNFEIAFHPQRAGEIISTANVISPDFKGHNTAVIGLKGRGGVWSGSVSGVWRRANSPYIIGGTVTVPVDASLMIEPGVVITIDTMLAGSTARFIVAGTLEAVGTATDSIIFTTVPGQERHGAWEGIDLILSSGSLSNTLPESPTAAMGDWPPDHSVTGMSTSRKDSFELEPTGNQLLVGSANLKYCRVAYARTGILAQSNNITIENCLLQHNREQGLKWYGMENSASGKISHSRIANNGSYGIYCHAYCSDVNGSANPQITFNEITQNGKAGIYLYAEGGDPSSWTNRTNTARVAPLIENNQVYNNSGFAIDGYAEGDETTGYISIHRSKAYLEPTITRNIIAHNQAGLRTKCQLVDPTDRLDFATVIVDRNTFWNHPGVQIAVFDSAKVILKNSILWGGSSVPFTVEGGQVQVSYCDIPVIFPGQGNFSRDPQLADPANRNFKLSMNSPCIDAGDPTGEKDPDYTIADVGALYYHQSISEFSLQQPAHQAVVRTQSPNLIWNVPATTGGEVLKYELVYSTSADFSQPETITRPDLTQNKYTLANPLADFTQYFWKVKAQNPWGLTRWSKEVFQFTVNTDTLPPTISANLPRLAFNEDDSLSIPRQFWYEFIEDEKTPDSLLTVNILSGRKIKVFNRNKMVIFKASKDWFGTDTLQLQVRDAQNLSNSAAFSVQVRSINDPPFFTNLPDSIMLPTESRQTLKIWDYVGDVESSDAQLQYQFAANNNLLNWKFDASTGILTLQSLQVPGRTRLDIMVRDDSSAAVNRAIQIRVAAPTGLSFFENEIPTRYQLYQNFPNPFNPETTIAFSLPAKSNVSIAVFNLKGEKVQTLFEGEQPAGNHLIQWNGQQLASGTYFIKMQAGDFSAITRSILLK